MGNNIICSENIPNQLTLESTAINIAGATTNLRNINSSVDDCQVILPHSPDGTVTYDSATGVITDFTKDVDPKYGDVAADVNEAVARAFEGDVKNGDLRLGGAHWSGNYTVTDNIISVVGPNVAEVDINTVAGTTYNIKYEVTAAVTGASIRVRGSSVPYQMQENTGGVGFRVHTFTAVDTGVFKFVIYPLLESRSVSIRSISSRSITNEVVTERVDMWGFEQWHEEVTDGEVFDCIQSLATTFGDTGVPTVLSKRPLSYFQVYDGQFSNPSAINDQYRCVDWNAITDVQKKKVAAYLQEKLFVGENGLLVNVRVRQRTIAGAGNGDWHTLGSTEAGLLAFFLSSPAKRVSPQGKKDVGRGYGDSPYYYDTDHGANWSGEVGVFTGGNTNGSPTSSIAYKGECYFLVCGTVPRLNQGANVQGLNDGFGSALCSDGLPWYSSANTPTTLKDCFIDQVGGTIASGQSGRSDGRKFDAIYPGGAGGVIDMRLSAHDEGSTEKASEVRAKVENGAYRGMEKLVFTKWESARDDRIRHNTAWGNISGQQRSRDPEVDTPMSYSVSNGCTYYTDSVTSDIAVIEDLDPNWNRVSDTSIRAYWLSDGAEFDESSTFASNLESRLTLTIAEVDGNYNAYSDLLGLSGAETNISVSGEFAMQDIIGDPANILQTDALKDGWYGSWIPVIPDGNKTYPLTRKQLDKTSDFTFTNGVVTSDNGGSWASMGNWFLIVDNGISSSLALGSVYILSYTAFAKQTTESVNSPVLHGEAGLGSVYVVDRYTTFNGAMFVESILGKIPVSSANRTYQTAPLKDSTLSNVGEMFGVTAHEPITLTAPANNSPAAKSLAYQVASNNQASMNFAFNELVYDGDWGDDSTIKIADGVTTGTDLNGNTRLIGTHTLALPYGWVRNKI